MNCEGRTTKYVVWAEAEELSEAVIKERKLIGNIAIKPEQQ